MILRYKIQNATDIQHTTTRESTSSVPNRLLTL